MLPDIYLVKSNIYRSVNGYDYDADFPPVTRAFKQAIADADAVLFVTPEYNRSIPGG